MTIITDLSLLILAHGVFRMIFTLFENSGYDLKRAPGRHPFSLLSDIIFSCECDLEYYLCLNFPREQFFFFFTLMIYKKIGSSLQMTAVHEYNFPSYCFFMATIVIR